MYTDLREKKIFLHQQRLKRLKYRTVAYACPSKQSEKIYFVTFRLLRTPISRNQTKKKMPIQFKVVHLYIEGI